MVWQCVGQAKTRKPPDRDVDLGLAHQAPIVDDPDQETRQHEPQCHLGVDAGPTSAVTSVTLSYLRPEPTEVEHLVHPGEHMLVRHEFPKRACYQKLRLPPRSEVAPFRWTVCWLAG